MIFRNYTNKGYLAGASPTSLVFFFLAAGRAGLYGWSSGAGRAGPCGSSGGGGARRSSSLASGKVCSKAFLTADRVIACIDRTVVRLLAESGSLILDHSHALHDAAINYYLGVDLYLPALVA